MCKRILVIDDDAKIREIIAFVLTHNGFEVEVASNGTHLPRLLEAHLPDLVLLDVMMPGRDGYQLFDSLRHNPLTQHIPIIIMTAHAENIYARISQDLGATHMTKPFHPLELVEKVKSLLEL